MWTRLWLQDSSLDFRQAGRPAGRLGGGGWPRYPIVGLKSPSPLSPVTESPVTIIFRYRYIPQSSITVISRDRYRPVIFARCLRYRYPPLPLAPVKLSPVSTRAPLSFGQGVNSQ